MTIIKEITKQGVEQWDLFSYLLSKHRTIWIIDDINDQISAEVMAKIEYLDSVNQKPIKIFIDSPGGSVSAGFAILDAMERAKSEIEIECTGQAASMAAILVACGGAKGKRAITKNAEMMIHQPLGGASGQATDVQLTAIHLTKVKKRLIKMLAEATGQSVEKISHDIDRDYWMNAEEAVKYGLVDYIC